MIEGSGDARHVMDVLYAVLRKANENSEYTERLDDPNELRLSGLEQLRRGEPGTFTEEDANVLIETAQDHGFRLGAKRGAEEMLAWILDRLDVGSTAEAEVYIQRGRKDI